MARQSHVLGDATKVNAYPSRGVPGMTVVEIGDHLSLLLTAAAVETLRDALVGHPQPVR